MPDIAVDARAADWNADPDTDPSADHPRSGALQSRLLRLSVLPAALTAMFGAAAVSYLLLNSDAARSTRNGAVLLAAGIGCVVVLGVAAGRAAIFAGWIHDRIDDLRSSAARTGTEVHQLAEQARRGEPLTSPAEPVAASGDDPFALLAHELAQAKRAAVAAVVRTSAMRPVGNSGQQVEVFVNLSRRLQSLVHREIRLLDDLENEVEDPDLLKGLFQVDHLATRIRRHAENLAVLGGAVSRRQWSRPVTLTEVLRSSIAEVEHYSRVKLVPPIEGTLRGDVVADIIHLVAELVENATMFAPPQTQVVLRAQHVTAGVAVEVEDRGLGMPRADQDRVNRLLANPDQVDLDELLRDGRIGLFVVAAIARRHGIVVRLQTNIYGGIQAVLIFPPALLGSTPQNQEPEPRIAAQPVTQKIQWEPLPALTAEASTAYVYQPAPQPAPLPAAAPAPAAIQPGSAPPPGPRTEITSAITWETRETRKVEYGAATSAPASRSDAPPVDSDAGYGVRPPQLPQRQRQTHMAAQLHQVPETTREVQVGEHDPDLMANFMRGADRGANAAGAPDDPQGTN